MVLAADYKQIELRLMAHFSSDAALCALLRNPAQDPFILLAAEWKKVPVEQVCAFSLQDKGRMCIHVLLLTGAYHLAPLDLDGSWQTLLHVDCGAVGLAASRLCSGA